MCNSHRTRRVGFEPTSLGLEPSCLPLATNADVQQPTPQKVTVHCLSGNSFNNRMMSDFDAPAIRKLARYKNTTGTTQLSSRLTPNIVPINSRLTPRTFSSMRDTDAQKVGNSEQCLILKLKVGGR